MRPRIPHPFAPPRPGGTPTEELIDRHAHLVAVGLANCRAAQALKKEITRRQVEQRSAQLETRNSKPEALSNDDDHYNPSEHRDEDGKWTTGPDASGSKSDSPSHIGLIAKIGKGFNLFGKALVAELADIGSEITGQAKWDRRAAEEAYEEAENSVPWTDSEWEAVHQAMRNNDTKKLQELIDAHNAKVALVAERNPKMPLPDNMTQLMSGDQDLRAESDLKLLPGPARVAGRAVQELVESSPRMAAVAMLQSFGVPAPVAVGLVFGTTEHGFDLKQAAFAAALYFAGEYSGEISAAIVKRFGGDNAAALKALKTFMANAAPAAGVILQQQLAISKLPPDQQKDARIEMWATLVGMAAFGPHGEESEGEPGKAPPSPKDIKKPAEPPAALEPYGGPGGGHHVPAKSAFRGDPNYDMNEALAMPNAELDRLGANHRLISVAQRTLYQDFEKTGQKLTWEAVERIETDALMKGGVKSEMIANEVVKRAISALKASGVNGPTRIPWGN